MLVRTEGQEREDLSGTFYVPSQVLPYMIVSVSGITKIKISVSTIQATSNCGIYLCVCLFIMEKYTHKYHLRPNISTCILVYQRKTKKKFKPKIKNPYIFYTLLFIHF